jgi:polar amino acid transport system permease protein
VHLRKPKIKPLDVLIAALLLAAVAFVGYRINVGLTYRWNWQAIPQYLFRYDADAHRWVSNVLMEGFLTTIRLSVWATVLATIIGTSMGMLRISRSLFRRLIGGTYVELTRNLPPLVLIFIFYYFVSNQIFPAVGVETFIRQQPEISQRIFSVLFAPPPLFTAFLSALITLAVFEGAYITEIVRAGIQSIERGQWEAADALGFSGWQRMRYVIMPQAVARILPPLGGQFISTIKDSAIVSVISIQELTFQGMELMSTTYYTFEVWITITVLYLILTLSCSVAVSALERRLHRRHA